MIIKKINYIGKDEAIVTISDGKFEIVTFAQPFNGSINDNLNEPLLCLSCENIVKVNEIKYRVIILNNEFEQYFQGKVIDKDNSIVNIGNIKIELDSNLPQDINNDDFITFKCGRVDIIEHMMRGRTPQMKIV